MIDKKFLDILACPVCKSKLLVNEGKLTCQKCAKDYLIIDDIPVLLNNQEQAATDLKEK
jgi:hypothetical protein